MNRSLPSLFCRIFRRATGAGLFALMACLLLPMLAAAQEPPPDPDAALDAARRQVDQIRRTLEGKPTDAEVTDARRRLLEIQQRSENLAAEQAPALASVKARLTELGPVPEGGKEAPDVAEQRRNLQKSADTADARSRLAKLLALESGELAGRAGDQWRARFRAQLFERTDSVLTPAFWRELRSGWSSDAARLRQTGARYADVVRAMPASAWLGLAVGVAALALLRAWLVRRLVALAERAPPTRVRRSLYAVGRTVIGCAFASALASALLAAAGSTGTDVAPLAGNFVAVLGYTGFLVGLGDALLSARRPSWRLLPIADDIAQGLRLEPTLIAVIAFAGWLAQHLSEVARLSPPTEVAINGLQALALAVVLIRAVSRNVRLYRRSPQTTQAIEGDTGEPVAADGLRTRPWWLSMGLIVAWAGLVAGVLGILLGYVALGGFVTRQLLWMGVMGFTAWLLVIFIDDAFGAWFGTAPAQAPDDAAAKELPPAQVGLRGQAMVLTSAALRLFVVLIALVLMLASFGETPAALLRGGSLAFGGLSVGELKLQPTAVLQALVVFILALVGVRLLKGWLVGRYLPTTSLDIGMRNSIATLLGFVGTVFAIGLGLSAVGLALDKVAWIASALTVGIGFGLQAVVSNFVSGLILLAERPVKVGDWVALGGVEGDIRRINVRATEIQMGDRSTLIVPNSEFITKVVRNVTHESPLGLVQIKLPMPLDTDPVKARELLLGAFTEHPDVLDVPAPNVQLDGIDAGNLVFNATGFVASPRQSYGVRSALLFQILQTLPAAGLPLAKRPTMVLRETPPPAAV